MLRSIARIHWCDQSLHSLVSGSLHFGTLLKTLLFFICASRVPHRQMQTLRSRHYVLRQACYDIGNGGLAVSALPSSYQLQMIRGIKLFEIFSKEARVERKRKLKEDMQHGYFDDFRAVRDQEGKIFSSPDRLLDPQVSEPFPPTEMVQPDGTSMTLPPSPSHFKAALLCTAFRAGAEDMLESWSNPFKAAYGSNAAAQYYELSFVESAVMSVWPFKQMILSAQLKKGPISPHPTSKSSTPLNPSPQKARSTAHTAPATATTVQDFVHEKQQGLSHQQATDAAETNIPARETSAASPAVTDTAATAATSEQRRQDSTAAEGSGQMQTAYLFHFGDTTAIRKALAMPNRLTGYAYLIDEKGLVRWRGSGKAQQGEVAALLKAAGQLLNTRK